jgi:hypothetical protein
MKDYNTLRDRYLRDGVPVRLGGLASNLVRVRSLSDNPAHGEIVADLLNESKYFIEWTAGETEVETAAQLVELQRQLVRWQLNWAQIWDDPAQRAQVAQDSRAWSERVLQMSGLLDR